MKLDATIAQDVAFRNLIRHLGGLLLVAVVKANVTDVSHILQIRFTMSIICDVGKLRLTDAKFSL